MSDDLQKQLDDLEARFDALNRSRLHLMERLDEAEEERDQLRERVAELENIVDPDPGATEYEQLTRPQKVHHLRRHLTEEAATGNGKFAMKYREVKALFDGYPSAGHCYDLMKRAGELDGFTYDEAGGGRGQKRIRVNIGDVNDETLLHAVNKARSEEAV